MSTAALEQRLQALEDLDAIRSLKARYLACCDAKDPQGMRACFADGPVAIDYGAVGRFDTADAVVAVFEQVGCHPHMIEIHHGSNPQLKLLGDGRAEGHWSLHYQLINTNESTLTQLGAYYEDGYVKTPAGWKISATKCVVTSLLVLKLAPEQVGALVIGRVPAA